MWRKIDESWQIASLDSWLLFLRWMINQALSTTDWRFCRRQRKKLSHAFASTADFVGDHEREREHGEPHLCGTARADEHAKFLLNSLTFLYYLRLKSKRRLFNFRREQNFKPDRARGTSLKFQYSFSRMFLELSGLCNESVLDPFFQRLLMFFSCTDSHTCTSSKLLNASAIFVRFSLPPKSKKSRSRFFTCLICQGIPGRRPSPKQKRFFWEKLDNVPVLGRCNSYDLTEKRIPCVSFFFRLSPMSNEKGHFATYLCCLECSLKFRLLVFEVEGIGILCGYEMKVKYLSCRDRGRDACPSLSSEGASSHMRKKNKKPFLHDELTSLFLLLIY
jgi:hypothetical protein